MTRKDYILIAEWCDAMREGVERHGDIVLKCTFPQWCDRIAGDLGRDNPRFDRARFLKACGVQS